MTSLIFIKSHAKYLILLYSIRYIRSDACGCNVVVCTGCPIWIGLKNVHFYIYFKIYDLMKQLTKWYAFSNCLLWHMAPNNSYLSRIEPILVVHPVYICIVDREHNIQWASYIGTYLSSYMLHYIYLLILILLLWELHER